MIALKLLQLSLFITTVHSAFFSNSISGSARVVVPKFENSFGITSHMNEKKQLRETELFFNMDKLSHKLSQLHQSASPESDEKPYRIIIAGAPASGKGTQCELIKNNYGVVHLSTGDMLRAAVADETEVGKIAQEYMNSGKLVPDDVIIGVVAERLNQPDCLEKGWLLDGFPRTRAQADALASTGVSADCFLFLDVPDELLVERVVGRRTDPETGKIYHMKFSPPDSEEVNARLIQRTDDTEEKVKVRLQQFHDNVDSVKGCYGDIMVELDGNMAVTSVADKVKDALEKCRAAV